MSFFNSKILTVFLFILSVWLLFSVISAEIEKGEVKKEETAVENKITSMRQGNQLLERYIKNFENQEFLEKEARIRLNYKAPGEEVVFVHRDANSQKASAAKELSMNDLPNYRRWFYYLLGY